MKAKWITIVGVTIFIGFSLMFISFQVEEPNFNIKYVLWKRGWIDFDEQLFPKLLESDNEFLKSLKGMSFKEIDRKFGCLKRKEDSNTYQSLYIKEIHDAEFFWIGESKWGLIFSDGVLFRVVLYQG